MTDTSTKTATKPATKSICRCGDPIAYDSDSGRYVHTTKRGMARRHGLGGRWCNLFGSGFDEATPCEPAPTRAYEAGVQFGLELAAQYCEVQSLFPVCAEGIRKLKSEGAK